MEEIKIHLFYGFYEPNVIRRKIFKKINEKSNVNLIKLTDIYRLND